MADVLKTETPTKIIYTLQRQNSLLKVTCNKINGKLEYIIEIELLPGSQSYMPWTEFIAKSEEGVNIITV